jgi:alanyl-tRNA synthetase
MTERLYLADPYLTEFRARVVSAGEHAGKPAAVLDRSAFYPEGGGQPGDRGSLGQAAVLDTQEHEGEVLHLLDRPLAAGAEVDGAVDWARRLDHLQQHHGQHLLSAAFERLLQAKTVSFHLGERLCTIDLDFSASRLDSAALRRVESAANESVWRNLPVVARDFSAQERAALGLRKEPVKGDRVVVVEGVDASPCGGTHPRRTGDVGAIAILRAQRWGQGKARIEFACGGRVVRLLGEAAEAVAQVSEALKCDPREVAQAAARTAADSHARRKAGDALLVELARYEASALLARHGAAQPGPVVARVDRGAAMARAVATTLAERGATALIASVDDGRAHLCFARPKGPGPALNDLLKEALAALGGKGGGSPDFAQGSGDPARLDEAMAAAAQRLA